MLGLPGLTNDDESIPLSPCEVSHPSLEHEALLPLIQEGSLPYVLFDAIHHEEGDLETDTDFELRFHSLEGQISDAMSDEFGQGLDDSGSALLMRLDSPAKKLLDSIANVDEDTSDSERDASFITAPETLSENGFLAEDPDSPLPERRRSIANEIVDATLGEEGNPFDVERERLSDILTSEPSAEACERPHSLWVSSWSIQSFCQ